VIVEDFGFRGGSAAYELPEFRDHGRERTRAHPGGAGNCSGTSRLGSAADAGVGDATWTATLTVGRQGWRPGASPASGPDARVTPDFETSASGNSAASRSRHLPPPSPTRKVLAASQRHEIPQRGAACAHRAYTEIWRRTFLFRRLPVYSALSNPHLKGRGAAGTSRTERTRTWCLGLLVSLGLVAMWPCGTQGHCILPSWHTRAPLVTLRPPPAHSVLALGAPGPERTRAV